MTYFKNLLSGYKTSVSVGIIIIFLVFTQTAESADLTDIRTGFHGTHSRVVIQFDSNVKFQIIKDVENSIVTIDVLGVNAVHNFGEINLDQKDSYLKYISFKRSANLLSVTTFLKLATFRIEHYFLYWPFRIVLDIYPASFVTEQTKKRERSLQTETPREVQADAAGAPPVDSLQSIKFDSSIVDTSAIASTVMAKEAVADYDSTKTLLNESIIPLQSSLKSVKSELQKIAKKRTSKGKSLMGKHTLIIVVVAAFVLIDLILVAVYLERRSRKRKRPLQTRKRMVKKPPPSKQTNREFVEILKSTLESNDIEEVRKKPEVVRAEERVPTSTRHRLESMLRSFPEPKSASRGMSPTPPELTEIARDLGSIAPSSQAANEVTKEELIGKDGAEFLEKLQRQSFN